MAAVYLNKQYTYIFVTRLFIIGYFN